MSKEDKKNRDTQQGDNSLADIGDLEENREENLTKEMIEQNRKWALKKNRKDVYTSN